MQPSIVPASWRLSQFCYILEQTCSSERTFKQYPLQHVWLLKHAKYSLLIGRHSDNLLNQIESFTRAQHAILSPSVWFKWQCDCAFITHQCQKLSPSITERVLGFVARVLIFYDNVWASCNLFGPDIKPLHPRCLFNLTLQWRSQLEQYLGSL